MGACFAVLAAFATFRPVHAQPPPPMFSPWYAESLRGILELEPSDVARLELKLAANPEDLPTRLKLMAYHQRADRASHPQDRAQRARLALWLIEHQPESELLHSPVSHFNRGEPPPPVPISHAPCRRRCPSWSRFLPPDFRLFAPHPTGEPVRPLFVRSC